MIHVVSRTVQLKAKNISQTKSENIKRPKKVRLSVANNKRQEHNIVFYTDNKLLVTVRALT